jgi:membrane-associated PAP2 superfamily phosphatase
MSNSVPASTAERPLSLRRHALWPAAAFATSAAVLEGTTLDQRVADLFFDARAQRWIWGGSFWSNELVHSGGRDLVAGVCIAALAVLFAGAITPPLRRARRAASFVVLSVGLATGLVALLKMATNVDCPRDLARYGGDLPYVRLFEDKPDEVPAGACFPGGHSSGGFALWCLYFVRRDYDPPRAPWRLGGLAAGLAIGSVFAVGQRARGAHFPSHDLWSAAIAWFVTSSLRWAVRSAPATLRIAPSGR